MSNRDELSIYFLYCNVLCCQLLVLMFNLINSYPRSHRNSFSVKSKGGKVCGRMLTTDITDVKVQKDLQRAKHTDSHIKTQT